MKKKFLSCKFVHSLLHSICLDSIYLTTDRWFRATRGEKLGEERKEEIERGEERCSNGDDDVGHRVERVSEENGRAKATGEGGWRGRKIAEGGKVRNVCRVKGRR